MKIDQTIETPMGTIVFRGEVTDDELDYIIKLGLVTMYLKGELDSEAITEDGSIISAAVDTIQ